MAAGANPAAIKRGIEKAVEHIRAELTRMSTPIKGRDDIEKVGTIAANGDTEIGTKIAEAM
jgi:chaperonin GroEL